MQFYGQMPDSYTVVLNCENPLIKKLLDEKRSQTSSRIDEINAKLTAAKSALDELANKTKDKKDEEISTAEKDRKESLNKEIDALSDQRKEVMEKFASDNVLIKQITDLALLSNNMLKGKELNEFVNRSLEILK